MSDNSKLSYWPNEIDNINDDFKKQFGTLSIGELNWKLNPQSWSIAQNIDHLIKVNETYFTVVSAIRNGNYKLPFISRLPFVTNFFGKFILKAVETERKKKIKTFPVWKPQVGNIHADIVNRFVNHQEQLKNSFNNCGDLIEKETIIASPANKNIVYKLSAALIYYCSRKRTF